MPCREWGGDALQKFLTPSALGAASLPKLSHAKEQFSQLRRLALYTLKLTPARYMSWQVLLSWR